MKKSTIYGLLTFAVFSLVNGCAVIAGNEDSAITPPFTLTFVETLINQKSLAGESYRNLPPADSGVLLQKPTSVYADRFRVYVADRYSPSVPSGRVIVFDRGARSVSPLNITPPPGSSLNEGMLLAPVSIAVAPTGVIFVSDAQQGRVFGYDLNGRLVMTLGRPQIMTKMGDLSSPSALGSDSIQSRGGMGDLSSPSGIAIDSARNRLYIADTAIHAIKVYDTFGNYLFQFETGENVRFPAALALDRAGNLYVVDSLRLKVFIFNPEKKVARAFSLKGAIPGRSIKPKGIAVDSFGHVYVTDAVNNNVLVFDNEGMFLHTWGRTGRIIGDFWTPTGIFIDDRDYIYVVDQSNNRIQIFQYVP